MAELSAYEAKRQRRMAENRAALLALQIERLPAPKRPRRSAPIAQDAAPTERRRSARLKQLATMTPAQHERLRRLEKREQLAESYPEAPVARKLRQVLPATPLDLPMVDLAGRTVAGPRVSTKELAIRVDRFHDQWLGRQLLPLGKVWAMQGIVDAGIETQKPPVATFSRLSGVQPFRNALVLFVNVERDANYDNVFQEVGEGDARIVFFRWFAPRNWSRESAPLQRLVRVRRGDARCWLEEADDVAVMDGAKEEEGDVEDEDEPLLLLLRQVQGPYVYCGRLGFLGMRSVKKPLEIRWQLLDADALNWSNIRRQLIDSQTDGSDSIDSAKPEPTS